MLLQSEVSPMQERLVDAMEQSLLEFNSSSRQMQRLLSSQLKVLVLVMRQRDIVEELFAQLNPAVIYGRWN